MYFCPKCNFVFDISKTTSIDDTKEYIDNIDNVFELLKKNKNLKNYKLENISIDDIKKNKKYKKLDENDKNNIEKLIDTNISQVSFYCKNCGFIDNINETILLYQIDLNSQKTKINSIEDNKLISLNPMLPRTKDYNCKNINCITHKDTTNKEAVFYKENNSFNVNYVCTVCFSSW
jgi:hypothetical protein